MIRASTSVAFHRRQSGSVECAPWWRSTRGKASTYPWRGRTIWTRPCNVPKTSTILLKTSIQSLKATRISNLRSTFDYHLVGLLSLGIPLPDLSWATMLCTRSFLTLNMSNTTARITLLRRNSARRRACRRLMPWLAAVVAQTLLRRTIFGDMSNCSRMFSIQHNWSMVLTHDCRI